MVYKFEEEHDPQNSLEVSQTNYRGTNVLLKIENMGFQQIVLNKEQLYNLIGALHSLQSKINKIQD
jgi:hypothetical protein